MLYYDNNEFKSLIINSIPAQWLNAKQSSRGALLFLQGPTFDQHTDRVVESAIWRPS